jgi:hypothetical protein
MKYCIDFTNYNELSNTLKLSLQNVLLSNDNTVIYGDRNKLPSYLQNYQFTENVDDYTVLTLNNNFKNKAMLVFDELNEIKDCTTFACFNENYHKYITKNRPNSTLLNIGFIKQINKGLNSIQNIIVLTETEHDYAFINNTIGTFYRNSNIKFYIVTKNKVEPNFSNMYIIEPCLKKILDIENSAFINLCNQDGFATLINIFLNSNLPVATLDRPNVSSYYNDRLMYFTGNIKSLFMILDILIKKYKDNINTQNNATFIQETKNNISSSNFLTLLTQAYPINDTRRLAEIEEAVKCNLNNKFVENIICFTENDTIKFCPEIQNNSKIKFINTNKWNTFQDFFQYANLHLSNKYVGIINIDIGLDPNSEWTDIKRHLDANLIIAQARHEFKDNVVSLDENFNNLFHCHSQDGWFFKSPVKFNDIDFEIGTLGCDNALAHRLYKNGYTVLNLMNHFKLLHYDNVRGKTSTNFVAFHKDKKTNKFPEKKGYRLLPDYDKVINASVDDILKQFKVSDIDKYNIICDIFTKVIQIKND